MDNHFERPSDTNVGVSAVTSRRTSNEEEWDQEETVSCYKRRLVLHEEGWVESTDFGRGSGWREQGHFFKLCIYIFI